MDCDIVNKCLHVIPSIENTGARVHLTWVPSHVGIHCNDKAARLARRALQDDTVDPGTEGSLAYVKRCIKDSSCKIVALLMNWRTAVAVAVPAVFSMHVSPRDQ